MTTQQASITTLENPWADVIEQDWNSHQWQLKNSIKDYPSLAALMELTEDEKQGVQETVGKLAMAITPYFFNLIDRDDVNCPIRKQVIPRIQETQYSADELIDPCGEDGDMPVPGLVHRYPDRVLFLVTDRCASYCRYCTRSRVVSGVGQQKLEMQWEQAFKYLEAHTEVRDVLLSGGDPLLLSDNKLLKILHRLQDIEHIEFIRIGSRIPIFLPQRITLEFAQELKKIQPLFISIHANHPKELTPEVKLGLDRLVDAGVVLGNQSVLLEGVNDDAQIQKDLIHTLLKCRVRPYYLYQCDLIQGSKHFRVDIRKGMNIMQELRGHTTGYAVPNYVVDGPGGGGKILINPSYLLGETDTHYQLKNYKDELYEYPKM